MFVQQSYLTVTVKEDRPTALGCKIPVSHYTDEKNGPHSPLLSTLFWSIIYSLQTLDFITDYLFTDVTSKGRQVTDNHCSCALAEYFPDVGNEFVYSYHMSQFPLGPRLWFSSLSFKAFPLGHFALQNSYWLSCICLFVLFRFLLALLFTLIICSYSYVTLKKGLLS